MHPEITTITRLRSGAYGLGDARIMYVLKGLICKTLMM